MSTEAWLRGPIEGIAPHLMPAAHSLVQAREDLARAVEGLTPAELWERPGGAASIGFHLRHIAGSLDRLLTYARGEQLSSEQIATLKAEGEPGSPPATVEELLAAADAALARALEQLAATPESELLAPREVGRAKLPSNVLGLLFHAAEHTYRHTGQIITTAKVVRSPAAEATA
ncbi:MAG TPA: DinB family protein [Longimicrobiales bacterium]|nr:DinB family protein [Longimicrobiales bacterium]